MFESRSANIFPLYSATEDLRMAIDSYRDENSTGGITRAQVSAAATKIVKEALATVRENLDYTDEHIHKTRTQLHRGMKLLGPSLERTTYCTTYAHFECIMQELDHSYFDNAFDNSVDFISLNLSSDHTPFKIECAFSFPSHQMSYWNLSSSLLDVMAQIQGHYCFNRDHKIVEGEALFQENTTHQFPIHISKKEIDMKKIDLQELPPRIRPIAEQAEEWLQNKQ